MKRLAKKIYLLILLLFLSLLSFGDVRFSGLDVSADNRLLFNATATMPDFGSYDTLFIARLTDKSLQQLTFFPEKITFLASSGQLQIQNRYGVFRSDSELENIKPVDLFPAFVNGNEISTGKIMPILSSPDGKFLLYTRATSAAFGDLILYDIEKAKELIISKKIELSLKDDPGRWSEDSKSFIYSTQGIIYYFSINQYNEGRVLAENFRKVHEGQLNHARWGSANTLYYIAGSMVYRIASHEFFTKSLYSDLLKVGRIAGKIPFSYDPNFDSFWISPDSRKILLNKGGRNLFLYYLNTEDFTTTGNTASLPYLYLPRNTRIKRIVWSGGDSVTLLAESITKGNIQTSLFRIDIDDKKPPSAFKHLEDKDISDIFLSPEQTNIALISHDSVMIYNYLVWQKVNTIPYDKPITAVWRNEDELIIAGTYSTRLYNMKDESSRLISLSQSGKYGYATDYSMIRTSLNSKNYEQPVKGSNWKITEDEDNQIRTSAIASEAYRVYLEVSTRGSYRNIVMVRNISGYGTTPLLRAEEIEYETFPQKEDVIDFSNFGHGSRIRRREVALVFDAIETIEGLTSILNTLKEYNLKCTFFVNGEIIRRYPGATKEIAESGHEVGSLFYTHFNMTDSKFNINKDFIKQGLARTEDDYFAATGGEVSLIWHAPYYFVNSDIIQASKEMNYTYIGRDVDSMDWVTEDSIAITPDLFLPAADLVERILDKKKPGSIIPIQVGVPEGHRSNFLFQKLDLLINGLSQIGYDIVPVSVLIENAK